MLQVDNPLLVVSSGGDDLISFVHAKSGQLTLGLLDDVESPEMPEIPEAPDFDVPDFPNVPPLDVESDGMPPASVGGQGGV